MFTVFQTRLIMILFLTIAVFLSMVGLNIKKRSTIPDAGERTELYQEEEVKLPAVSRSDSEESPNDEGSTGEEEGRTIILE